MAVRWSEEEFAQLLEALREGTPKELIPDKPPAYATGRDAEIFARAARDEVSRAIDKFLTKDQIDLLVRLAITDRLNRIGLKTDEEHIDETGETIRKTIRWQKHLDRVFGGIIFTGLSALVLALLKLIGINVPSLGLGGH